MKANDTDKIIMGIDPGSNVMGFSVVHIQGAALKVIQIGSLNFSKEKDHYVKMAKLYAEMQKLMTEYLPDELAIEAPFYGKNIQSMLKLGRAQGVCITAALQRNIPIFEYAPKRVKQSITGNGNASKEQVAQMLLTTLNLTMPMNNLDATDALAVALCHHYSKGKTSGLSKSSNWGQFIKNNPGRLK